MAQADDILRRLQRRPFAPFRLRLTDGAFFDVRHPELLLPGRRALELGIPDDPAVPLADRFITIDLLHVVRLEPLEQSAAPTPEGGHT